MIMPINKAYWKREMAKLIKLARLPTSDELHISPMVVEEILEDVPTSDMSKKQKDNWYTKLHERK
jgi:hypothetical protein